ncbi:MAG: iron ABC transporter permease [Solirubrobacterales bacterium]|nr:iron ABC transporter permease [Solirubrobacterales bacterium]
MRSRSAPAPLAVSAVAVAALAALPLAYLLIRGIGGGADAWEIVTRGRTAALVGRTVALVAGAPALATAIGVGLAWLVVRTDMPGRRLFGVLAALPLVIPSYVLALAFIAAIGPGGLTGELWGGPGAAWIFGYRGATLALALATYPYVFLLTAAALRRMDPSLEEAARSLGRSRAAAFRQVTLPALRPAIGAGAVLVALYALSDFGVVSLLRYDALTRAIYNQYRSLFDREPAAVLGLVLVVLTTAVLVLEARSRERGRLRRSGAAADRPAELVPLGRWRWPAVAACAAVVAVALVLPVAVLEWWALSAGAELPSEGEVAGWAGNSLLVSLLAALAATAAALPLAALAARRRTAFARSLERVTYAANALPGIVIALSLVFFATRVAEPLYQTLALLVFAYVVRFLPQALAGASGALLRVDPKLEQASRGLGAGPWRTFARVTAPLVAPGLLAGATLVFLSTMKELPATLLLRPIGFDTLATEVWTATGVSAYSEAAAPALLLIVLSAPVVWLLQVRTRGEGAAAEEPPPRE